MKIANADKLIHHFEHTEMVKTFTVPEIVTIIERLSMEIPDNATLVIPRKLGQQMVYKHLEKIKELGIISESEVHEND